MKHLFPSTKERVRGILYGLIAGDKNHGPQAMGIMVGKALVENKKNSSSLTLSTAVSGDNDQENIDSESCHHHSLEFNQLLLNIFSKYLNWYHSKSKGWYDTGQIGKEIFDSFKVKDFDCCNSESLLISSNDELEMKKLEIVKIVKNLDVKLNGQTGGINPAHRNVILSMSSRISDEDLLKMAKVETRLTHYSSFACEASQMQNYICRRFIRMNISESEPRLSILEVCNEFVEGNNQLLSKEFKNSLNLVLDNKEFLSGDSSAIASLRKSISRGGFSPQTLASALYFIILHTVVSAEEYQSEREMAISCLFDSFQFAGSANYCPVLVGPILGAMYGDSIFFNNSESEDNLLSHSKRMEEALEVCMELSEMWN